MYEGRNMAELGKVPLSDWNLDELAFYHHVMSQLVHFLNHEGVAVHNDIIKEIERRGGLPRDRDWSQPVIKV